MHCSNQWGMKLVIGLLVTASVATAQDRTKDVRRAAVEGKATNVILFLGDGTGDSEMTIARNYFLGAAGRLNLDKLPMTGAYTTFSVKESNPSLPEYVPDSAGTAWATGRKTSNGRISTVAGSTVVAPLLTILKWQKLPATRPETFRPLKSPMPPPQSSGLMSTTADVRDLPT